MELNDHDDARTRQSPLLSDVNQEDDNNKPSTLLSVCCFILVTELCERICYYGLASSLVLLLQTELNYTNAMADNQYSIWAGTCYLTPLLGGYLADSYLGRYKAILSFCVLYLVGLVLLVIGVIPGNPSAVSLIFPGIYIIALGTGGIKPNVCTYGAEQFDPSSPQDKKELESFFNWFYWTINLGALISYTLVAAVCQFGIKSLGGVQWRFATGFTIPLLSMLFAVLAFVAGSSRYLTHPPQGSVLATALKILLEASWIRLRGLRNSEDNGEKIHWLDRAKVEHGGSFEGPDVEGVKEVWSLLPFLFFTIPYWVTYNQMSTAFQNQGCQMDLSVGSFQIAVSTLNLFDTLAILLLIPLFDRVIYPQLAKGGRPLTLLERIGCGFLFSILAMLVAGALEIYRKSQAPPESAYPLDENPDLVQYLQDHISACKSLDDYNPFQYQAWYARQQQQQQHAASASDAAPSGCRQVGPADPGGATLPLSSILCDDVPLISPISVLWQIPQFLLIGTGEILTSVTSLDFFYSQAPKSMRSFTQSLNLLTTALGTWLCIPIVYLVNLNPHRPWISSDLNKGYLANYFFLLALMMVVDVLAFCYVSRGYKYKDTDGECRTTTSLIEGKDSEQQHL